MRWRSWWPNLIDRCHATAPRQRRGDQREGHHRGSLVNARWRKRETVTAAPSGSHRDRRELGARTHDDRPRIGGPSRRPILIERDLGWFDAVAHGKRQAIRRELQLPDP